MKTIRKAFAEHYLLSIFCIVFCVEIALYASSRILGIVVEKNIGIAAYLTTALFVVTILELRRNLGVQRAAFVKDYVSKFFTDKDLYQAYFDLIYSYSTDLFDQVEKKAASLDMELIKKPYFDAFEHIQAGRQEGSRLYHPACFQGSIEERRLDAVLGYLDVIAYHYENRLISLVDLHGTIGVALLTIHDRPVIKNYMQLNIDTWKNPKYQKMRNTEPYYSLRKMLTELAVFSRENPAPKVKGEVL